MCLQNNPRTPPPSLGQANATALARGGVTPGGARVGDPHPQSRRPGPTDNHEGMCCRRARFKVEGSKFKVQGAKFKARFICGNVTSPCGICGNLRHLGPFGPIKSRRVPSGPISHWVPLDRPKCQC